MSFKIYKNGNWIECAGQPDISGFVPRTTTTTPASELQDKTIMYDGDESGIWKRGHIYHYENSPYWEVNCTDTILTTTMTYYSKTALSVSDKKVLYTDIDCTTPSNYSATTTKIYDTTGLLEFGVVNSSTQITTYYKWKDITDIPDLTNYVTTNSQQSISQMKTWEPNSDSEYSVEVSDTGIMANKYSSLGDIRGIIDSSAKLVSDGILFTYNAYQNKKLSFPQNKVGTFILDSDLTDYYTKTEADDKFSLKPATNGTIYQVAVTGGGPTAPVWSKYFIDSNDYTNQTISNVWNKCPWTDCTILLSHVEFKQSDDPRGTTGNKYEVEVHKTATNYGYIIAKNRNDIYKLNIDNSDYDSWYVFETIKTGDKFKSFGWGSETETITANTSKRLCWATFGPGKWLITAHVRSYPTGTDGFKVAWITTNPNGNWYWQNIVQSNRNQGDTQFTMSGILEFTEDINVYLMFEGNIDCKVPFCGVDAVKLK